MKIAIGIETNPLIKKNKTCIMVQLRVKHFTNNTKIRDFGGNQEIFGTALLTSEGNTMKRD
jgi:hypothetical protein